MMSPDIKDDEIPAPLTQIFRVLIFQRSTGADIFKIHELIIKKPMREQDLYLYEVGYGAL